MDFLEFAIALCSSCNEDHLSTCILCGARTCYKLAPACSCELPHQHAADAVVVECEAVA